MKKKYYVCALGFCVDMNRNVQFKCFAQIYVPRAQFLCICIRSHGCFVRNIHWQRGCVCRHYCNFHRRSCHCSHLHKYTIFSHLEWTANIEIMHQINWINFSTLSGRTDRQKWKKGRQQQKLGTFYLLFCTGISIYLCSLHTLRVCNVHLSWRQRPIQQQKLRIASPWCWRILILIRFFSLSLTDSVQFLCSFISVYCCDDACPNPTLPNQSEIRARIQQQKKKNHVHIAPHWRKTYILQFIGCRISIHAMISWTQSAKIPLWQRCIQYFRLRAFDFVLARYRK